jgi:hypothetical protein
VKGFSEVVLNFFKCAALVAAGFWAFYKFDLTETPQLAPTLKLNGTLEQGKLGQPAACDFKLTISINNDYKSPVEIKRVNARLWFFESTRTCRQFPVHYLVAAIRVSIAGKLSHSHPPLGMIPLICRSGLTLRKSRGLRSHLMLEIVVT